MALPDCDLAKVSLHVVDLAFALFASQYVRHDDLQDGTSFKELEWAATERDCNTVDVSPALGRYAFHLVRRFESKYPPTDQRSMTAHAVCSWLRMDFHSAGLNAPG